MTEPAPQPDRKFMDRHGPLAWFITACVSLLCALATVFSPDTAAGLLMVAVPSICGMHYGRERARAMREVGKVEPDTK